MEESRLIEGLGGINTIPQKISDLASRSGCITELEKLSRKALPPNQILRFLRSLRANKNWTKALAIPDASIDMAISLAENIQKEIKDRKQTVLTIDAKGKMMLLAVKTLQIRLKIGLDKIDELIEKKEQIATLLRYGHLSNQQSANAGKAIAILNARIARQEELCEQLKNIAIASAIKLMEIGSDYQEAQRNLAHTIGRLYRCAGCAISGLTPEIITNQAGESVFYPGQGSVVWQEGDYVCWQSPLFQSGSLAHQRISKEMNNFLVACGMSPGKAADVQSHEDLHSIPDYSGWSAYRALVNPLTPEEDFVAQYQMFGDRTLDTVSNVLNAVDDPSEDDKQFREMVDRHINKHGPNKMGTFSGALPGWVAVWETNPVAFEQYERVRKEIEMGEI